MKKNIRVCDSLINKAELCAKIEKKSVSGLIEHWALIGKVVEENPDLPYRFIRDTLAAKAEMKQGKLTPYHRRKPAHP